MRISSRCRHALAAVIEIAGATRDGETISVASIADKLGTSKVYLEQLLSQLKKDNLIYSYKGPKGGYQLSTEARRLTALDVIKSMEPSLFETTEPTVEEQAPFIEAAMRELVFQPLDTAIQDTLGRTTIQDLLDAAQNNRVELSYMLNL